MGILAASGHSQSSSFSAALAQLASLLRQVFLSLPQDIPLGAPGKYGKMMRGVGFVFHMLDLSNYL